MQRLCLGVLFSLLVLNAAPSFAQEVMNKAISGYIREEGSGHVITAARIELQNLSGVPTAYAYSDGNGAYEFDNIAGGDCYLVVSHNGYVTTNEFVRPEGSGHVYKDIFLRTENAASAPTAVNPVSERELSIPPKAHESFEKGLQLVVEKSDYRGAVAQFEKAIEKYPSYYEAYAALGLAQDKMGDAPAAEASLRKSIDLSGGKYPQAMIDLASMFNGRKRFSEAEPLLRNVIAVDGSSWRGQYELAVALRGQNRFTDAVASAAKARDLKPDNPPTYLLLYNLHIQTDDFPAALQDADSYLKLAPTGPMSDRVRKMREEVQKAVQGAPNNSPKPPSL
ncbi:MAG: tetratricopeptide repeat protein [Candidatus Acidiferrum sp.]